MTLKRSLRQLCARVTGICTAYDGAHAKRCALVLLVGAAINIDNTKEAVVLHPSSLKDSTGSQSALFLLVRVSTACFMVC